MTHFLSFAYLAKTASDFSDKILPDVYAAAVVAEWEELQIACFAQFQQRLSVENCLPWLEWAVLHNQEAVRNRSATFAATHMDLLQERNDPLLQQLSTEANIAVLQCL